MTDILHDTQAPIDQQPQSQDLNNNPNLFQKTWVKVSAGIGGVALATGLFLANNGDGKEAPRPEQTGSQPTATAEAIPGQSHSVIDYSKTDPSTLSTDSLYENYPEELRLKYASELVSEKFSQSLTELNEHLQKYGRPTLPENTSSTLDENSSMTSILNYQAVVDWMAAKATTRNEGEAELATIVADSPNRKRLLNGSFGDLGQEVAAVYEVALNDNGLEMASPVFHNQAVGDYTPSGSASRVATVKNSATGEASQVIMRFSHDEWLIVDSLGPDSDMSKWTVHPEDMTTN